MPARFSNSFLLFLVAFNHSAIRYIFPLFQSFSLSHQQPADQHADQHGGRERSRQPAWRGVGRPTAALLRVAGRAPPPSASPAPRGGEEVRPEVPEPLGPGEVEPLGEGAAHAALEVAEDVHPPDVEEVVVLGRLAPGRDMVRI